jgi:hydroxypyruvate isomerase
MITWSAHLSTLFTEHSFPERPAAARAAGFTTGECWWPPADLIEPWVASVQSSGLRIALLNADAGDLDRGDRGFLNIPARREDNVRRFSDAVRLALRVGASRINVLVGRAITGVSRAAQIQAVRSGLVDFGDLAARSGLVAVVEHLNDADVPGYLLPRPRDVAALIESVGLPEVRMLYDAYHAARTGADPASEIGAFRDLIGHVQFADCPGRGAPGTGRTRFWPFIDALARAGYRGAVGLEYVPNGPTVASLGFLRRRPPGILTDWRSMP